MVAFLDRKFSGMIPKLPAHELPDGYAQVATNCDFRHGDLRPIRDVEFLTPYHSALNGKEGLYVYEPTKSFIYFNRRTHVVRHPTFGVDRYFTTNGTDCYETGIVDSGRHPAGGVFNGDALSTSSDAYSWPYQTIGMKAPQAQPEIVPFQEIYVNKDASGNLIDTAAHGVPAWFFKYEYEVNWQKVNKDGTRQKMESLPVYAWDNGFLQRRAGAQYDVPTGGDVIIQVKIYDMEQGRKLIGIAHSTNAADYDSGTSIASGGVTSSVAQSSQYPTAAGFEVYDTLSSADLYAIARSTSYDDYDGSVIATPEGIAAQKVIDARMAGTATQQATIPAATSAGDVADSSVESTAVLEEGLSITVKVAVTATAGSNAHTYTDATSKIEYTRSDIVFTLQFGDFESRVYCYTCINKFGEESPPSPPSIEAKMDSCMSVNVNIPVSWSVGGSTVYLRNYQPGVTGFRIYRTVTGSDGTTNYHLFREIGLPSGSAYFADYMRPVWLDTLRAKHAKETLPTIGGIQAPAGLQHIQPYSSGILMGFVGDELCFSQDYQPYAWPVARRIKSPYQIRAAATVSNGVLLGTDGGLFIASGATPESMGVMRIPEDTTMKYPEFFMIGDAAAAFTSDGLSVINGQSVDSSLSQQYWTREDWLKWANGNADFADDDLWFGYGIVAVKTFNNSLVVMCGSGGYIVDLEGKSLTNFSVRAGAVSAAHFSPRHDELFLIAGGYVCRWGTGDFRELYYKSKNRRLPFPVCLRAAKITLGSAGTVGFQLFADGVEKHFVTITSDQPYSQHFFRLPSGYKAIEYSYGVSSTAIINEIHIAETMTELRGG